MHFWSFQKLQFIGYIIIARPRAASQLQKIVLKPRLSGQGFSILGSSMGSLPCLFVFYGEKEAPEASCLVIARSVPQAAARIFAVVFPEL